jgi:DNA-directed RNA polymerase specialized sigma subunit
MSMDLDRIVSECEPLIRAAARAFVNSGVPLSDLMTVGRRAIVEDVIPRYDPDRGAKLQTYGRDWVRQRIKEEVYSRLPLGPELKLALDELTWAERRLLEESGEPPSDEQLAQELGWSLEKTTAVREWERSREKEQWADWDKRAADPAIRETVHLASKRTAERLAKKVINRALQYEAEPIRILFNRHRDSRLGFFWGDEEIADIADDLVQSMGFLPSSPGYGAEVRRQGERLRKDKERFLKQVQDHRQHRGTSRTEKCFGCRIERFPERERWPVEDLAEYVADP